MSANDEVSEVLLGIADLLDLQGEKFKPEAYRRAARSILGAGEDLRGLRRDGRLSEIPGVGEAIQKKIEEFLDTGKIDYYERLKQAVPPGRDRVDPDPGVGPKTAARFQLELGIDSPAALLAAIDQGRLAGVAGFGPKKIANLRKAVANAPSTPVGRMPLRAAWGIARGVVEQLRAAAPIEQVEVAGSLRRRRENVGDLDILATSSSPERAIGVFSKLPGVREVVVQGDTKCTVIFDPGIQIDLRVVASGELRGGPPIFHRFEGPQRPVEDLGEGRGAQDQRVRRVSRRRPDRGPTGRGGLPFTRPTLDPAGGPRELRGARCGLRGKGPDPRCPRRPPR